MSAPVDFVDLHPTAFAVLGVLSEWHETHPMRPTLAELGDEVGRSPSSVLHHLRTLRALGLADWEDGKRGTLRATVTRGLPEHSYC
jgi:DNA-binding IclR family transcriptional regulator